jgi:hypothetical protein
MAVPIEWRRQSGTIPIPPSGPLALRPAAAASKAGLPLGGAAAWPLCGCLAAGDGGDASVGVPKGVAVASTLFLVARRAAQLTFPCGAFVFFLGTFDPILVLVAIVRKLSRDFVWSAWRSGAFVRFELYDLPNRELVHGALIRLLTVNLYGMDRMRASMSRDLLPVSCREPVDPERSGRKVPLPPMRYWNWPIA